MRVVADKGQVVADENIVSTLESLLERARAGEIQELAYCYVGPNESVTTNYAPYWSMSMIAGLQLLQQGIARDIADQYN